MALTITKNDIQEFTTILGTITFDNSYPDGGEAIAASDLGLTYLKDLAVMNGEGGIQFAYDPSAGKIKAFDPGKNRVERFTYFEADFDTGVVEMWRAPFAGSITKVTLHVGTTGTSSGATEIDVKKGIGGTSIFSAVPSVAFDDADGTESNGTLKTDGTEDFNAGDIIELSIATDSATTPANMIVEIEFSTPDGEVVATTDLSSEVVGFIATGVGEISSDDF